MSDRIFLTAGVAAVATLLGAWYLYGELKSGAAAEVADGPGPNLVIDVEGQTQGQIVIDLLPEVAPKHVAQITELARTGAYNGIVFHRVIDGFMAQTGDVQYGRRGLDPSQAGTGGSDLPDITAEFSDIPFLRGTVGMARTNDPDSANSQFFIMFAETSSLNGEYTVFGHVVSGMEVVDKIKRGDPDLGGAVTDPDYMAKVTVVEAE